MLELMRHHRQKLVFQLIGLLFPGQQIITAGLLRLAFCHVAGNFCITAHFSFQARHYAAAKESSAILAQMPALVHAAPVHPGTAQFLVGSACGSVFGGKKR